MARYGVNFSDDCIFQVCSKAIEPGNKNRRLNTSILICYVNSVGRFNILVDAGKYASNLTMFSLTCKVGPIYIHLKHVPICF